MFFLGTLIEMYLTCTSCHLKEEVLIFMFTCRLYIILSYIVFFNLSIVSNLWEDDITIVIYQVAGKSKYIVFKKYF